MAQSKIIISYSFENLNSPTEWPTVFHMTIDQTAERTRFYQYEAIRAYGTTFLHPEEFHPDLPFMTTFKLPHAEPFPTETLHMLWYMCHSFYIPFEFDLREIYILLCVPSSAPDNLINFLSWFQGIDRWKVLFRDLLRESRAVSGAADQLYTVILVRKTNTRAYMQVLHVQPFSILGESYPQVTMRIERSSAAKNGYTPSQGWPGPTDRAPWESRPNHYLRRLAALREEFRIRQEGRLLGDRASSSGVQAFDPTSAADDDVLREYENMSDVSEGLSDLNMSPSHEPIN